MLPEDRLDALLTLRVETRRGHQSVNSIGAVAEPVDLQPLLFAADRVAVLRDEEPSEDFAARLEAMFLSRATYLRERDGIAPRPMNVCASVAPKRYRTVRFNTSGISQTATRSWR